MVDPFRSGGERRSVVDSAVHQQVGNDSSQAIPFAEEDLRGPVCRCQKSLVVDLVDEFFDLEAEDDAKHGEMAPVAALDDRDRDPAGEGHGDFAFEVVCQHSTPLVCDVAAVVAVELRVVDQDS
jgi:hypothetical protein